MENEVKEVVTEVVESNAKKVVDVTKEIIFVCGVIVGACGAKIKDKVIEKIKHKKSSDNVENDSNELADVDED